MLEIATGDHPESTEPESTRCGFMSPLGRFTVEVSAGQVRSLHLVADALISLHGPTEGHALCLEAQCQVMAYLQGRLRSFDLPLAPAGTPFQRQVWEGMAKIPYGATQSYGELARKVKNPGATQAVGSACGANPIPLIIPCHRVLAAAGRLGGFGLGLDAKRWLLDLETYGRPPW